MRVSRNAGEEPTGFAELEWRTTVAGTGQSVIFTVFVAYVMEGGAWMVTEIRVLS